MKVAILGAGISGLSLFDILYTKHDIKADLYEKEEQLGGLCRTRNVNGYIYDVSGGHIFNTKFNEVKEYVFSLLDVSQWEYSRRISNINFSNKIIDYPFEFSLSQLPVDVAVECIEGLFERNDKKIEVSSFDNFLKKNFGEGVYKYYLKPYNEKIWKMDLDNMDYDWVDGKMPCPNSTDILKHALSRETNEDKMVHSYYYYPKYGGIQALVDNMARNVDKTVLKGEVLSIEVKDNKTWVNGKEYDLVINTIPLPELMIIFKNLDKKVADSISNLKFNSVLSYLFPIERKNNYSWTYIPDSHIISHRMVYQGNFSPYAAPEGKSSITVEITSPKISDEQEILKNIKDHLGLSNPIAKNFTKYGYVVFDKNRKNNIDVIKDYFGSNIILHGRFAEWTYPNMDVCINNSLNLSKRIASEFFCR